MTVTQRMMVTGRVQQVGYRNWTIGTARSLGITGWVRNVDDSGVEIIATGEPQALDALAEACRTGPRLAQVADVSVAPSDDRVWKGFTKRFAA